MFSPTKHPLLLVLFTILSLLAMLIQAAPVAAIKRSDDDQAPKFDTPKEYFKEFEKTRKELEKPEVQNLPISERMGRYTQIYLQIEAVTKMVKDGDYDSSSEEAKEVERWNEWKEETRQENFEDLRKGMRELKDEKKGDEGIDDSRDPSDEK